MRLTARATSNPEVYPKPELVLEDRSLALKLDNARPINGRREARLHQYAARLLCNSGRKGRRLRYTPTDASTVTGTIRRRSFGPASSREDPNCVAAIPEATANQYRAA